MLVKGNIGLSVGRSSKLEADISIIRRIIMADNKNKQLDPNFEDNIDSNFNEETADVIDEAVGEPEAESLENITTNEQGDEEETEGEEQDAYTSQFGELEDYVEDYNSKDFDGEVAPDAMPKQKKKMKRGTLIGIIIAVAVVLVILGVGAYFVFFNNTIKGVWVVDQSSTDGSTYNMNVYYEFGDDSLVMSLDTEYMSEKMTYDVSYLENNKYAFLSAGEPSQTYSYEITGNLFQGKKVSITSDDYEGSQALVLTYVPFKETVEMQGPEFKKNDDIVGYWKMETSYYGMESFMQFTDDGMVNNYTITPLYSDILSFKYNYDGKQITTISAGGTDSDGNTVEAGSDSKIDAAIKDGKLTISSGDYDTVYVKSSEEEFNEYKKSIADGTYESATLPSNSSATEVVTGTAEGTVQSTTEAVTSAATEAATAE